LFITTVVAWIFIAITKRHHDRLEKRNSELQETNQQIEAQKSEIEQTALTLSEANEQLSKMNKEKDEFIGIVAHDLRNPLNGIIGLCEVTEPEDKELKDFVQDIHQSGERMLTLIETLLDVSRIEGEKVHLQEQSVELNPLILEARSHYAGEAKRKKIQLSCTLEASKDIKLSTDPDWLQICINNLISNAVKYTPEYGHVFVSSQITGDRVEISIEDSGPGIDDENQKKLFKKFVRLAAKPTGGESSTGLGLYLVKNMCDRLGIEIKVKSRLSKGTTFTLSIPFSA
jgi:signal transduction histidine kinase